MATAAERIGELLNLAREADLATLITLDREIHSLLEQKQQDQRRDSRTAAREEFRRRYPRLAVDPELFALVGIHPATPVEEDKRLIRAQIARSLAE